MTSFEITCSLSAHQNLYHASRIYTGLSRLQQKGLAKLKFTRMEPNADSYTVYMEVKFCQTGSMRVIAMELLDRSDSFEMKALVNCDVYFKRSYYTPDLVMVPEDLRAKIQPFGLNYACRDLTTVREILRGVLTTTIPGIRLTGVRHYKDVLWQFLSSPHPKDFERSANEKADRTIVFQTRVWAPSEILEDAHQINSERVALVRALRKAFGPQFVGGLVPTVYAKQNFPRDISSHSPKHSQYAKWGKKSLIGVNSRGLHNSLAFKFGEYLAASKCIVSCPIMSELPAPLVPGQHYLTFQTPEECVDLCAALLRNSELATRLRRSSWEYYREEVEPEAHLMKTLARATKHRDPTSI